jgi:methionine synthase II (cobalamin-independent)
VVTDGEFRRRDFRTGFVDAVDGFAQVAQAVWAD